LNVQNERHTERGCKQLSSDGDLPVISAFVCPGSSQPVSRAVHLSRLNAAWSTCDQCEWRQDTEGLASRTIEAVEHIRNHRGDGVRRTEFGIRGRYINDLDRRGVAELVRVFCRCLNEPPTTAALSELLKTQRSSSQFQGGSGAASQSNVNVQPVVATSSPVVIGYDGRSSSPDIFVGVTSAVREFGISILDVGRCTAASIQEAVRSFPECSGAILVTGAGMPPSWTGLDVFDTVGDSVPVVWKDFGVRLQHVSNESEPPQRSADRNELVERDPVVEEMLRRVRQESDDSSKSSIRSQTVLRLQLPIPEQRQSWARRLSRQSGSHEVIDFEDRYRQWLLRWYPQSSNSRILVRSDDPLIGQRVAWLSSRTGLEIVGRSVNDTGDVPSCRLKVTIHEDDREFTLANGYGEMISPERLAAQLNDAIHSKASQVTAHADAASGRFWLTDSGRPLSAGMTEHIRDGLAVVGLLAKLMETGRLSLQS
jgi:hypothetical protein